MSNKFVTSETARVEKKLITIKFPRPLTYGPLPDMQIPKRRRLRWHSDGTVSTSRKVENVAPSTLLE